nr:nucleotidyltransferase family protein [Cohnella endophytica]
MERSPVVRRDLEAVQCLGLPNWCIAAGYVRNRVWDELHGYAENTRLNDVDVLYFDPLELDERKDKLLEEILRRQIGGYHWSVKNQARMHRRNGHLPYESIEAAMLRWPETATAVGIALESGRRLRIISPHGLEDLFGLVIRRSPLFSDHEYFLTRVREKDWLTLWPRLKLVVE